METPFNWDATAAEEVDYYLPKPRDFPVGKLHKSLDESKAPKLFQPIKIGNMTVNNRIGVSPMCTYSAAHSGDRMGMATPFHFAHYASFALRAPGLIMTEALAINPQGRLSPEDLGIWSDAHALELKKIVDFAHAQGVKIGCQVSHGGRKSSGISLPIHLAKSANKEQYGWADTIGTVAPSAVSFSEAHYVTPKALTKEEIKDLVKQFKEAADRCYNIAGFDFVEVHAAHGYLLPSFLSSLSNTRTDEYGGSFENRTRFLIETVDAVNTVRGDKPVFVRFSASDMADGVEGAWTVDEAKVLALQLADHKVDFLDVSDGGNYEHASRRKKIPAFQLHQAKIIKEYVGDKLVISTVGGISDGKLANDIVESGEADFVLAGSAFLKNPGLAWTWADQLGVRVNTAWTYTWPYFATPYKV